VRIGVAEDIDTGTRAQIENGLRELHPWRKGPFEVFGIFIDTEWHSDWKWQRLKDHIQPLTGRTVLDVGCGNGYHCFRMAGAGAKLVIGIDPTLIYVMQFEALQRFAGISNVYVLPLRIDDVPEKLECFDTVFAMGVLYHRRSPLDHLYELRDCLKPGGELVLETLVIEGGAGQVLVPRERYARMGNVWFIPSVAELVGWLQRCGFSDITVVDVTPTTTDEQRSTDWMTFESLSACLDSTDPKKTVEGYPAPVRAILVAKKFSRTQKLSERKPDRVARSMK
jgi:tRNA (mo5U34)-methyltransferase